MYLLKGLVQIINILYQILIKGLVRKVLSSSKVVCVGCIMHQNVQIWAIRVTFCLNLWNMAILICKIVMNLEFKRKDFTKKKMFVGCSIGCLVFISKLSWPNRQEDMWTWPYYQDHVYQKWAKHKTSLPSNFNMQSTNK